MTATVQLLYYRPKKNEVRTIKDVSREWGEAHELRHPLILRASRQAAPRLFDAIGRVPSLLLGG
jgi:hypothetical protein